MLYMLILTDLEMSYEYYSEDFTIGIFKTKKQAEETALYYLKNVKGFRDYPCTYQIIEKNVNCSDTTIPDSVWIVQGWNLNENSDEVDIIESSCFLTEAEANFELQKMRDTYQRTEWTVNHWQVGRLEWRKGFVRD